MDSEFEIEILGYYLNMLFEMGCVDTVKLANHIVEVQMWDDPDPRFLKKIRRHIRGIKKDRALIYTKIFKINGGEHIIKADDYITLNQILELIKYPERFIEFEPLSDGSFNICYSRKKTKSNRS